MNYLTRIELELVNLPVRKPKPVYLGIPPKQRKYVKQKYDPLYQKARRLAQREKWIRLGVIKP